MANEAVITTGITEAPPRVSEWRRFRRVFLGRILVLIGLILISFFVFIAIFAPLLAPYPPNDPDLASALQQPSAQHLLGTDALGRDTLSRVIYGARTSLMIGLIVVIIATIIGMTLGLVAGYYGGWTYNIIMRFIDALMSFPMILLAMVIAALLGNGMRNVIIALSVAMMPGYARLMCAQVLAVKENDYVTAGRSIGASNLRLMLRHIVPNCLPPLIVLITMQLGSVILAEAGLSFLGIGITPPTPAWGSMVNDGRQYLLTLPILSFAPGLALMLVVFGFNMVGDGLRDALDPRLRGAL
ncbi:MAG: ABC transporter permease [Dehalococcoidales bacterium]|jgi:ABC-type dipeptide/oligopeptide/nickel transport system permease subunit|nr:ABC transporter permease [Dehalococcoidales bacterium]